MPPGLGLLIVDPPSETHPLGQWLTTVLCPCLSLDPMPVGGIWIYNRSNVAPLGSFGSFLTRAAESWWNTLGWKPADSWKRILNWLRFPMSRPRYQTLMAKKSWIYVELLDSKRYIFSLIAGNYDSQWCAGRRRQLGAELYSTHQRLPSLPHLYCQRHRYKLTSAQLFQASWRLAKPGQTRLG